MPITEKMRQMRRNHIGASDTPAILLDASGKPLSRFGGTPGSVYWAKVEPTPDESSDSMSMGNMMEEPLVAWAETQLGIQFRRNQFRVSDGPDGGILSASHDGINSEKRVAVQAKYCSQAHAHLLGDEGTDQVPDDVLAQCSHEMYVSDLEEVWVPIAVATFALCFRMYRVKRNEGLIQPIRLNAEKFWNGHVAPRIPPAGWESVPVEVLQARHRVPGKEIMLPETAAQFVNGYEEASKQASDYEDDKQWNRAKLLEILEDAEIGILPDGRRVSYKAHEVKRIDPKALRFNFPDAATACTLVSTKKTFRISKGKEENGN